MLAQKIKQLLVKPRETSFSLEQKTILATLNQWAQAHLFLRARIRGDAQIYQSLIVSLDLNESCLVLDEFFPKVPMPALLVDQEIHFSAHHKNQGYTMVSTCLDVGWHEASPVYRFGLPKRLGRVQRRRGYRLNMTPDTCDQASLLIFEGTPVQVGVRDISVIGIAIELEGDWQAAFEVGACVPMEVVLKDLISGEVLLDVRRVVYHDDSGVTILGCAYQQIASSLQAQLSRQMTHLQRVQARHRSVA